MQTRIKQLRQDKGISQEVLAGFVNSSQQAICRYERNVSNPPSDIIVSMAHFFEVSTDYILCCSDSKMSVEMQNQVGDQLDSLYREFSMFRKLGEKEQNLVRSMMRTMLEEQEQAKENSLQNDENNSKV